MVNPKEDYYAALELRPNADPDEIKKQFKKLGN
jgi:curved DNA-binding protein CbpA